MARVLVLKKGKEFIVLRKAMRLHQCHECGHAIPKDVLYVEDHLAYPQSRCDGSFWMKRYTNRICLLCWRGSLP